MKTERQTNPTPLTHDPNTQVSPDTGGKGNIKLSSNKKSFPTVPPHIAPKFKQSPKTAFQNFLTRTFENMRARTGKITEAQAKTNIDTKVAERNIARWERMERQEDSIVAKMRGRAPIYTKSDNAPPKIDHSAVIGKLNRPSSTDPEERFASATNYMREMVEQNTHFGKFDSNGFDVLLEKIIVLSSAYDSRTANPDEMRGFAEKLKDQGRDTLADCFTRFANAIDQTRTKEGGEKLFSKLAAQATKPTPTHGTYMRSNDHYSAALGKLLNAIGIQSTCTGFSDMMMKLDNKSAEPFVALAKLVGEERLQLIGEKGKETLSPSKLSNAKQSGVTEEEAKLVISCTKAMIEKMGSVTPDENVVKLLKSYADDIQKKVGPGGITQDDANKMIHTLYNNVAVLRGFSPELSKNVKLAKSDVLPSKLGLDITLNFVQQIANGGLKEMGDYTSTAMKNQLATEGKNLMTALDDVLCKQWGMPETARM